MRGRQLAMTLATGVLAWRFFIRQDEGERGEASSLNCITTLPAEDRGNYFYSTPLPAIEMMHEPIQGHWADRYLEPVQFTDARPVVAQTSVSRLQPAEELLAPASWMLGMEPMPVVEDSHAEDENLRGDDKPLNGGPSMDMHAEPLLAAWSPPPLSRLADVAAFPDEIELPAPVLDEPSVAEWPQAPVMVKPVEPMTLGGLLWAQPFVERMSAVSRAAAVVEATALPMVAVGEEVAEPVPELPIEESVSKVVLPSSRRIEAPVPSLFDDAGFQPFGDFPLAPEAPLALLPQHGLRVRPSMPTALGLASTVAGDLVPFTTLPESVRPMSLPTSSRIVSKTHLPLPRTQFETPKSSVPVPATGFSAASKALNLPQPVLAGSVMDEAELRDEADTQVLPPPPRNVPRAPVAMAPSEPSRKASAWLGFWK
jgi:hypothetical protein